MYAKKIKATDFNGVEREETFYFNLTEAELAEMSMSKEGGLKGYLEKIVEAQSEPEIIAFFKKIIKASYGEKSNDGKYFRKNETLVEDFCSTEFYSVLFMELAQDANKAAEFINGVIPAKFRSETQNSLPAHPTIS